MCIQSLGTPVAAGEGGEKDSDANEQNQATKEMISGFNAEVQYHLFPLCSCVVSSSAISTFSTHLHKLHMVWCLILAFRPPPAERASHSIRPPSLHARGVWSNVHCHHAGSSAAIAALPPPSASPGRTHDLAQAGCGAGSPTSSSRAYPQCVPPAGHTAARDTA